MTEDTLQIKIETISDNRVIASYKGRVEGKHVYLNLSDMKFLPTEYIAIFDSRYNKVVRLSHTRTTKEGWHWIETSAKPEYRITVYNC